MNGSGRAGAVTSKDFPIEAGRLRFNFTCYYYLGSNLDTIDYEECDEDRLQGIRGVDWVQSETTQYVSNGFLDQLVAAQFHLKPPLSRNVRKDDGRTIVEVECDGLGHAFRFEAPPRQRNVPEYEDHTAAGALEATIFRNGYMALTVRLRSLHDVQASNALPLIQHPEFVSSRSPNGLEAGALVQAIDQMLEGDLDRLHGLMNRLGVNHHPMEEGCETKLPRFGSAAGEASLTGRGENARDRRRSRPYVGTHFELGDAVEYLALREEHQETVKRFVVAAGRATPAFLTVFEDASAYLDGPGRNVYGSGGSIVFIGRRGWCVFDAGEHHKDQFERGVVNTSHFVITAIDTAARSRRRYARQIQDEGTPQFRRLNASTSKMAKGGRASGVKEPWFLTPRWWREDREKSEAKAEFLVDLADATDFLARARLASPCEDVSRLLVAHLISHTAIAAVGRCVYLQRLKAIDTACREKMANYTAFARTSSDLLSAEASEAAKAQVRRATVGIGLTIAVGILLELREPMGDLFCWTAVLPRSP